MIENIADLIPSVQDFGAVGDGVTDDTDALQQAIDASRNEGALPWVNTHPLYFPPGEYLVSRPLFLGLGYGGW